MPPEPMRGLVKARAPEARKLPRRGCTNTFIVTSAQNNTGLHEACWNNLLALAHHDGAEVIVASFTYNKPAAQAGQKRKTSSEAAEAAEWWDPALAPYTADRSIELAPGLVWCGELQILPTAVNPISGLESYTGRASTIIPHVKHAVRTVPGPKGHGAKFVYTSGTVTLRNYIQKKAGQKAEFHHNYGGLIVEVMHDGTWFVRQLSADNEGVIYDLDRKVDGGRVTGGHRPEAIVWGDIHTRQLEPAMRSLGWGAGGILDVLRPRRQVMHDVLDFRSQNHHDRADPWKVFAKHVARKLDVEAEVAEVARFLALASRPWCETAIVAANHDEAMLRWLRESDYREDPVNARFMLVMASRAYRALQEQDGAFHPVAWAVARAGKEKLSRLRWLARDEEYVVCPDAQGGIDLGFHGDKGPNGSRGSPRGFARMGRKVITGDAHSPDLTDGAMRVGVMGALDQGYNIGPSSWAHTNALVYLNGKRTLFTISNGRWRG